MCYVLILRQYFTLENDYCRQWTTIHSKAEEHDTNKMKKYGSVLLYGLLFLKSKSIVNFL